MLRLHGEQDDVECVVQLDCGEDVVTVPRGPERRSSRPRDLRGNRSGSLPGTTCSRSW